MLITCQSLRNKAYLLGTHTRYFCLHRYSYNIIILVPTPTHRDTCCCLAMDANRGGTIMIIFTIIIFATAFYKRVKYCFYNVSPTFPVHAGLRYECFEIKLINYTDSETSKKRNCYVFQSLQRSVYRLRTIL